MSENIIQLLSDHLANQIAAGEVIHRPSAAVKELMENAIDAGATEIKLMIKDAGKELIAVIDNGKGMSTIDARMAFERHATSKIKSIDDLFRIRTMGFRGEALASIAAVAQVEMKTKRQEDELGTLVYIEGTNVKKHEPIATINGTSISIKNLFYNVPARRQFLKSNTTEFKHIIDEFTRIALANPQISFRLEHNGAEQYRLNANTLKGRIIGLFGHAMEKELVAVQDEIDTIQISGFIGKPSGAMKSRGMQFFFLNGRFIKSAYLNHAVNSAYEGLIAKDSFPFYVIQIQIDPTKVDVNVHPSKQEVKFDDDRLLYTILQATAKHALARNNIAPSLDFTLNPEITQLPSLGQQTNPQSLENNYLTQSFRHSGQAHAIDKKNALASWKAIYDYAQQRDHSTPQIEMPQASNTVLSKASNFELGEQTEYLRFTTILIANKYIATTLKSGLALIHAQRAQERIYYERWCHNNATIAGQQLLFPIQLNFTKQETILLMELLPELKTIGFDIEHFGQETFVIHALPSVLPLGHEQELLQAMIHDVENNPNYKLDAHKDILLKSLAKKAAKYSNIPKQPEAQQAIVEELFAGFSPEFTPNGKKIIYMMDVEEIEQTFK